MQSLQLLPFQCPRPITLQLCQAQFRKIHDGRRGPWTKTKKPYWKKKPLSLHEELFPEEANLTSDTQSTSVPKNTQFSHLPRLDVGPAKKPQSHDEARQSEAARAASQGAYRHWDLAVLVGGKLSRSLTDNDFRRIAPKGRHIDGWTGVGDILKSMLFPSPLSHLYRIPKLREHTTSYPSSRPPNIPTTRPLLPPLPQSSVRPDVPAPRLPRAPHRADLYSHVPRISLTTRPRFDVRGRRPLLHAAGLRPVPAVPEDIPALRVLSVRPAS